MTNEDGDIFCSKCAGDIDDATPAKAVQKMINNLETKCLTLDTKSASDKIKSGDDEKRMSNEGDVIDTKIEQCEWKGPIKKWMDHSEECGYVMIGCIHCNNYQSSRRKMKEHHDICPKIMIPCPLSCGLFICHLFC